MTETQEPQLIEMGRIPIRVTEETDWGIAFAVRHKLTQWADYHNSRSNSTPATAYTLADRLADDIFQARKPVRNINTDEPLNLSVSDAAISDAYRRMKAGERVYSW